MHEREAFLLPEYHLWFPGIRPGTWLPAGLVAYNVRQQQLERGPRWHIEARVLSPKHFAFREGREEREGRWTGRHPAGRREGDPVI